MPKTLLKWCDFRDWGDGSVGEVLVTQTLGSEFKSQNHINAGCSSKQCDPRVPSERQEMEAVQSLEALGPASLVQQQGAGHTSGDVEGKVSNLRSDLHATNMFSHTCTQAHKHTEKLLLYWGIVQSEFKTSTEYLPGLNWKGPRRGRMACAGFSSRSHPLEIGLEK